MGIDAEMFVRLPSGSHIDEARCLALAAQLAATVGASHFFIQHEELAGLKEPMWGWKPHHALSIMRPIKDSADAEDHGLEASHVGKVVWTQDGDPIVAEPHEQFVRVYLWSRYYGLGYERGNWPVIHATVRFLKVHLPTGVVYYGGDSSGVLAEPMTDEKISAIDQHYMLHGHAPYRSGFGVLYDKPPITCRCCMKPMHDVGGSSQYTFLSCDGCGWKAIKYNDGRITWHDGTKNFFELTREVSTET